TKLDKIRPNFPKNLTGGLSCVILENKSGETELADVVCVIGGRKMKTYKFILAAVISALSIVLSGCNSDERTFPESGNSVISDQFEKSVGDDSTDETVSHKISYGFGLHGDEAEFERNSLNIPMLLKGSESSVDVGVMVYIDGILQGYSSELSESYSVMNRFNTVINEDKTIPIYADAKFDGDLEEHTISGISILFPDFYPESGSPFFGNNHKALSGASCGISIDGKAVSYVENVRILQAETPKIITSEQKEKYEIRDNVGDSISLRQSGSDSRTFTINGSGSGLELDLAMYTASNGNSDYRLSFYKNHTLTKFNGEYDYLDVKVEGGKIVEAKINIDDVKIGNFLYCVAVPLNSTHEYVYPIKTDSIMVINSDLSSEMVGDNSAPNDRFSKPENNSTSSTPSSETTSNNAFDSQPLKPQIDNTDPALDSVLSLTVLRTFNNGILYQNDDGIFYSKNGVDITKSAQIDLGSIVAASAHGDYFSVICLELSSFESKGMLLDKEMNVVKSIDLQSFMDENTIDTFDFIDLGPDAIYFVDRNMRFCSRAWDGGEVKVIADAESLGGSGMAFTSIKRADNYTAFTANKKSGGATVSYYGIIKDSGEHKIFRKDGIASPQTVGNITLWSDAHVMPGAQPSGEIVLYKDGKFVTLKTQDPMESAYAILCDNGVVVTQVSNVVKKQDSDQPGAEIKVYDGNATYRISIPDYTFPSFPAVVYLNGKVITSVTDGGVSKSIITEV
ncbi:MAG: hypothetical protein NC299_14865, partial [Lachnospiraceae bacterium]|nr:hypothetical protein [Ruminococcus sp.]MCM1276618.1 hypothetical protein [Lachnospiraceae bacterium]